MRLGTENKAPNGHFGCCLYFNRTVGGAFIIRVGALFNRNMDYLRNILNAEIQMRKEKKVKTLKKDSHLPKKTFDKSKVTEGLVWQLQKAERFDYKNSIQSFVIVGPCASGKTSLASEIGSYALAKEAKVTYTSLEDLLLAINNQNKKWSRIQILCNEGRIDGAMKVGPTWVIPADAEKPGDQRIKSGKYIKGSK